MLRWYLILTRPSGEEVAKVNLERQGYRVYLPRLQQRKLCRGRWIERISALFPRYLFLQITDQQSLAPVRSTIGVADTVRFGSEYAVVPGQVVDDLIRRADPQSGFHRLQRCLFDRGETVRVVVGAFAGLEGIFEHETGDGRVIVLFTLLGRDSPVRIPAGFIVPSYAV